MFQRLPEASDATRRARVDFTLDGAPAQGFTGDSVAAALLALGRDACRETAVSGMPRGPYCMMGVCFDCLVVIDGTGNRQGCMVRLRDGMVVETQAGKREIGR
ncbi:(2Fe-2S)-binding protein [Humitalea sp. 24SJ18S-53]|uniref:(2Fe-2S)-binding protein n=1 Tax=Humitalea sp. 24SJ18S-53 TaxID=3422307 RepID=UPI003D665CBA